MRKIIVSGLLSLFLAAVLTSCGDEGTQKLPPTDETVTDTAIIPDEDTATVDETLPTDDATTAIDTAGTPDELADEIAATDDIVEPDDSETPDNGPFDPETLIGVYAEKVIVSTIDKMSMLGEFQTTGTYYSVTRIEKVEGVLQSRASSCHSVIKSTSPATTTVPDALSQCIGDMIGALTVEETAEGPRISRAEAVMPVGIELADPWNDPLPTDNSDPRIIDQDNDGNPGVTIEIAASGMTGKVYTIRRERGSWWVQPAADGRLKGQVQDASEQRVIGADNALFNSNPESTVDPDPTKSTIELVKLDGDTDCAGLIARIPELFPE
ncbi:MAG TPA: hypothetical protein PLV42_05720 [bacterium]|nr:hypothetical protein [bacterium]